MPSLSACALSSATAAKIWGTDIFLNEGNGTQAPQRSCRTEQDKWKRELGGKALWREWVEGTVGGERGCLAGK